MTHLGQNEMKPKGGRPQWVRLNDGLGSTFVTVLCAQLLGRSLLFEERPKESALVAQKAFCFLCELECNLTLWILKRIDAVLLVFGKGLKRERPQRDVARTLGGQQVAMVDPAELWNEV